MHERLELLPHVGDCRRPRGRGRRETGQQRPPRFERLAQRRERRFGGLDDACPPRLESRLVLTARAYRGRVGRQEHLLEHRSRELVAELGRCAQSLGQQAR